jgi:hypothetical protein
MSRERRHHPCVHRGEIRTLVELHEQERIHFMGPFIAIRIHLPHEWHNTWVSFIFNGVAIRPTGLRTQVITFLSSRAIYTKISIRIHEMKEIRQ